MVQFRNVFSLFIDLTTVYFTGDAKFCSATYRLYKLPKTEKSPPLQVIYSGDVTGFENQLDFDRLNHFKVIQLIIPLQTKFGRI